MAEEQDGMSRADEIVMVMQMAPPVVPVTWAIEPCKVGDEPGMIVTMVDPSGTRKYVLSREMALLLSRELKKQAQTGPDLEVVRSPLLLPPGT